MKKVYKDEEGDISTMKWKRITDYPEFDNVIQSEDGSHLLIKTTSKTRSWFSSQVDEGYAVINLDEKGKKIGFNK